MPPPTQAADPQTAEFQNLRDSYVPLFNGQPAEQKEYRAFEQERRGGRAEYHRVVHRSCLAPLRGLPGRGLGEGRCLQQGPVPFGPQL